MPTLWAWNTFIISYIPFFLRLIAFIFSLHMSHIKLYRTLNVELSIFIFNIYVYIIVNKL